MTLSRFLRDYLYIPLGGNRNGKHRRYLNLMITMLLGGLWHGAGWTFVIWGGLHGLFLVVNQAYRSLKRRLGWQEGGWLARIGAGTLTFLAVVVGWVFFRADSVSSAITILRGMLALNGVSLPRSLEGIFGQYFAHQSWIAFGKPIPLAGLELKTALFTLAIGFAIAWGLPNVRQLFLRRRPTTEDIEAGEKLSGVTQPGRIRFGRFLEWHPSRWQGAAYGMFFVLLLIFMRSAGKSEFLYFQF